MTEAAAKNLLQVEQVSKQFDGVLAVSKASFEVMRGEVFGLLGPNGAGKTTLIRMILGILKPDTGSIAMQLSDGRSALFKERVGYLPEERGLYEDRRVSEVLVYLASLHGMETHQARDRALYWLSRFGLEERFHSRIKELSKGMQQKVQFVAAVLHQPELVVLDEPFSGLDPPSQDFFSDLIFELAHDGMTVLLSSHQMNLVENLCDRVFLINRGQRVLYGGLNEIKRDHGEIVVWLRYRTLDEPGLRKRLAERQIESMVRLGENELELLLPKGLSANALLGLLAESVEIEELSITKPPLHRVFVDIIKRSQ